MKVTKRKIALIQMEQSYRVLAEGDFISALTLAGAAEEILGKMAKRRNKESQVELEADYLQAYFWMEYREKVEKKKIVKAINNPRNHLKHQDDGKNISLEIDFQGEAEAALLRCMYNYHKAFGNFPRSRALREWFDFTTL